MLSGVGIVSVVEIRFRLLVLEELIAKMMVVATLDGKDGEKRRLLLIRDKRYLWLENVNNESRRLYRPFG